MPRAPTPAPSVRVLRVAFLLGLPLLAGVGVAWLAARDAARGWPSVETPPVESPGPALPTCADGDERLAALLRLAAQPDAEPSAVQDALDRLLACGGLRLAAGLEAQRGVARLRRVVELRLARAQERSDAGDLVGAAEDLGSVLRLSAILEHAGGQLDLCALGVELGLEALQRIEDWLGAHPRGSEPALATFAEVLGAQVALPAGVDGALVWECRQREEQLRNLATIPAPAMLLEPAGVPLWVGWLAEWLPGTSVYDAPRTLAMHRHRCAVRLAALDSSGAWAAAELGPPLWDPDRRSLGVWLDNPLGRITLSQDRLQDRADPVIQQERTLRSRRALLAVRVAVERGSLAHDGLLPLQLSQLVPEYLADPPVDPVDGKPINWVRGYGEIFTSREEPGPDGRPRRLVTRVSER